VDRLFDFPIQKDVGIVATMATKATGVGSGGRRAGAGRPKGSRTKITARTSKSSCRRRCVPIRKPIPSSIEP
jgi:hypothetical protein